MNNRQTGRTTRMLKRAIDVAKNQGAYVVVLGRNEQQAIYMKDMARDIIAVDTPMMIVEKNRDELFLKQHGSTMKFMSSQVPPHRFEGVRCKAFKDHACDWTKSLYHFDMRLKAIDGKGIRS